MNADVYRPAFQVGDRVRVLVGGHTGDTGRIVVRRPIEVPIFGLSGVTYEVDFEFGNHGRGYRVQFQAIHLERIDP